MDLPPDRMIEKMVNLSTIDAKNNEKPFVIVVTCSMLYNHRYNIIPLQSMIERKLIKAIIFIPWHVLDEVEDHGKENPFTRKIINYIMEVLENKKTGMFFQTAEEAEKSKSLFASHFDETLYKNPSVYKTLNCCLHWKQRGYDVALFTDDNELLNKAQIFFVESLFKDM
ncbi:hypothetical protein QYM36_015725 [Artemia franciscana]|uniref:PIN domain-containing protein n=1 Tax=Artemia franciscana TaxID=6661 RepID=A0AA88HHH2_ARTSF|nr:hypothetical protein QYM36_015725 [Artemia franciscana]